MSFITSILNVTFDRFPTIPFHCNYSLSTTFLIKKESSWEIKLIFIPAIPNNRHIHDNGSPTHHLPTPIYPVSNLYTWIRYATLFLILLIIRISTASKSSEESREGLNHHNTSSTHRFPTSIYPVLKFFEIYRLWTDMVLPLWSYCSFKSILRPSHFKSSLAGTKSW